MRVATITFVVANFDLHKKSADKVLLHIKRYFLLLKFSKSFTTDRKMWSKSSKMPVK